ncbi:MAG: hypothetical protein HYW91_00415 [Candidatus Sungbacteria bacterium]|nr:hypothetical protein [Candidatus Sungbacteria bacterium]
MEEKNIKDHILPASILIAAVVIAGAWVYTARLKEAPTLRLQSASEIGVPTSEDVGKKVLPSQGVVLPIRWGDLGVKMVSVGLIDKERFGTLYAERGGLSAEERKFLEQADNGQIKITPHNSGIWLNIFWALGLGTKNDILDAGPMVRYGGAGSPAEALAKAGNFASTGGWTLSKGDAMEHYSRHPLIALTPEEQELVERVSKNIYRPCCNNPTYFPDCNHGMAMLGLLELMASQGVNEEEMYKAALQVNAYWFPDTYLTIAQYLSSQGVSWEEVNPKEILGANYSSGSGYRKILDQVTVPERRGGGSCGV